MTIITRVAILSAMLFASPQALACDYPQRAGIPDGATATKEEMIDGQREVKSYMAAMEEYLSCIESAEQDTVAGNDGLDEDARQQRIAMFNKKYNAAVDEMNLVAAEFNIQVRAYKERNK
ncbi:MAG: hypothetical protein KJN77_01300 [Gammaproteobacteria bacterium]|nr:hypothetical protein [Gammaproteobacteria bacterium]MBU2677595.1 hypothetical protein [Gammaproteobacteria bacterium]NNL51327.1 hypothetical protein [Woeseiaceae bacterium]